VYLMVFLSPVEGMTFLSMVHLYDFRKVAGITRHSKHVL
jgi:hypothetical protein